MRLRTKFAIVLLLVTVVLSGATYGGLELFKQQQRADVQDDVDQSSRLAADGVDSNLARTKNLVGYVASRATAEDLQRPDAYAKSFLQRNADATLFGAAVVDVNGTVTAFESDGQIRTSVLRDAEGSDASDEAYYQCVLQSGTTCVTPVDQRQGAAPDQRYFVEIASPIVRDGEIRAVFVAAVTLNRQSFFNPLTPLATSEREVRVVADGETVYTDGTAADAVTTGQATVDETGWTVYVTRDATELNEQLQLLGVAQGVGLFLVLSSIVGFGYWQYNASMRQAERLVDAFGQLRDGDFSHQVDLTAGEEWEQISDGYNQMSTDLAERERQLRDRQQRLEVLYRVIRHNIRNEMSVILNYADIAASMTDDDQVEMAADTISDTGRKLTSLSEKARQIQNALDAADETGRVDAAEVARETVADHRESFPDVTFRTSIPESSPAEAITGLELAVENVVENAAKHDDSAEPTVDVAVGGTNDRVFVSVADGGPGIPEQERNVLNEGRETSLEHGSGLGLWLVYWVVDRSGGRLRFDENHPRGSVVTLVFDRPTAAGPHTADPGIGASTAEPAEPAADD